MQGKLCCKKRNKYDQVMLEHEAELIKHMHKRERLQLKDVEIEVSSLEVTSEPSDLPENQNLPAHLQNDRAGLLHQRDGGLPARLRWQLCDLPSFLDRARRPL